MYEGWFKTHRRILKWEWYKDANTFRLFFHCLAKANYEEKKWRGFTIPRKSFVTSLYKLAEDLDLSVQQIRTSINKLKSTHEITHIATHKHSVITVCNYDLYQPEGDVKQHSKQHRDNTVATHTKNIRSKEIKEYSEQVKKLVRHFYKLKSQYQSHKIALKGWDQNKKLLDSSFDTIDKLNRIDKVPMDIIQKVIIRSIKDEFWSTKIISLAGLRGISKNKQTKFMNAYASLLSDQYRPEAQQKELLGYSYKCPACLNETTEREYKNQEEFDAYTCKVDGCSKTQMINNEMVGSTLIFIEKIYKEES